MPSKSDEPARLLPETLPLLLVLLLVLQLLVAPQRLARLCCGRVQPAAASVRRAPPQPLGADRDGRDEAPRARLYVVVPMWLWLTAAAVLVLVAVGAAAAHRERAPPRRVERARARAIEEPREPNEAEDDITEASELEDSTEPGGIGEGETAVAVATMPSASRRRRSSCSNASTAAAPARIWSSLSRLSRTEASALLERGSPVVVVLAYTTLQKIGTARGGLAEQLLLSFNFFKIK